MKNKNETNMGILKDNIDAFMVLKYIEQKYKEEKNLFKINKKNYTEMQKTLKISYERIENAIVYLYENKILDAKLFLNKKAVPKNVLKQEEKRNERNTYMRKYKEKRKLENNKKVFDIYYESKLNEEFLINERIEDADGPKRKIIDCKIELLDFTKKMVDKDNSIIINPEIEIYEKIYEELLRRYTREQIYTALEKITKKELKETRNYYGKVDSYHVTRLFESLINIEELNLGE